MVNSKKVGAQLNTYQIELGTKADLLTIQDIKEILEVILPRRIIGDREILEIIKSKHEARLSARESHHRRLVAEPNERVVVL